MKTFKRNDKVRSVYNEVLTVQEQIDNIVYTYEAGPVHITKVFLIK